MSKQTLHVQISGMTCVNCSNAVERVTKKLDGVEDAKVSSVSNDGTFVYEDKKISQEQIIEKVEKLGYKVHFDQERLEEAQKKEYKHLKSVLILCAIISVVVMAEHLFGHINIWIIAFLATVVQFYCGARFYTHSYSSLKNGSFDMNVLVAIGTSAAYFYSLSLLFFESHFPPNMRFFYFDGSVMIITFVLLGKFLEERSKYKATDLIKSMMNLAPKMATVLKNGKEESVHVEQLGLDEIVVIRSGESVSCDGVIIEGEAEIDMSLLSGESLPVYKQVGDSVVSGTICKNGFLKVKVTKLHTQTMLSQIVALLYDSQNKKVPIGRLADRISQVFVPTVIAISFCVFMIWYLFSDNMLFALLSSVSVLIISCPCALGLATPISIVSAVSRGAKDGILVKNPEIFEKEDDIKYAVFDKTGTITKGEIVVHESNVQEFHSLIYSLELKSEHPISKAIVNYLASVHVECFEDVQNLQIVVGKGIKGEVEGKKIIIGSMAFLESEGVEILYEKQIYEAQSRGYGVVSCAVDGIDVGYFTLFDEPKVEASGVMSELKNRGIIPVMLTGDSELTAKEVAKSVGIELVFAEVLPHEKHQKIKELQQNSKVLFVGDGINDSASLKIADIGISMNSGSDIAKESGDVVLLSNDLQGVVKLLELGQKSMRVIRQNLFWAFAYNALGIPIAGGVLYPFFGILLTPMYASMAMSVSSVTVVLNALRLKNIKL